MPTARAQVGCREELSDKPIGVSFIQPKIRAQHTPNLVASVTQQVRTSIALHSRIKARERTAQGRWEAVDDKVLMESSYHAHSKVTRVWDIKQGTLQVGHCNLNPSLLVTQC
jgi:hypothetical protein